MSTLRQAFVIQSTYDGSFLGYDLNFYRSLKLAGRCWSMDEAIDTAMCNATAGEFEIHSFWVVQDGQ